MIRVSLRDWIVKGELGPFRVGASKAELIRVVGHPDQAGCPEDGEDQVWKYGDLELLFTGPAHPFAVYCVEMHAFAGVPSGGRKLRLDPWIVRSELPLVDMRRALDGLGVTYREEVASHDASNLNLVVREDPRIYLDFITSDRDGQAVGLRGLWMSEPRRVGET